MTLKFVTQGGKVPQ